MDSVGSRCVPSHGTPLFFTTDSFCGFISSYCSGRVAAVSGAIFVSEPSSSDLPDENSLFHLTSASRCTHGCTFHDSTRIASRFLILRLHQPGMCPERKLPRAISGMLSCHHSRPEIVKKKNAECRPKNGQTVSHSNVCTPAQVGVPN